MKILVIEDDLNLQQHLLDGLSAEGYSCQKANDGLEGYYQASEYDFDLAIIDIGLPKINGIELISRLRNEGCQFPILILTARGGWKAKVEGLESGADDYMEKPFHIEELVARSRALLRRATGYSEQLTVGPITLNIESQLVTLLDKKIDLTAFEYKILEYMMRRPTEVISKKRLTEYLYEQDFDRDSNVVEVLVARLRKKLVNSDGVNPIITLRGRGYQFNASS